MSKPIYKPSRPYTEDINDLVEKGGKGSGVRGHKTAKPAWADSKPNGPIAAKYKIGSKLVWAKQNGQTHADRSVKTVVGYGSEDYLVVHEEAFGISFIDASTLRPAKTLKRK